MKYFLPLLSYLVIIIPAFAQRDCGSFGYHQSQLQANPSLALAAQEIEQFTQQQLRSPSVAISGTTPKTPTLITIPVVVHIIYNTAAQNISDAQVLSQIDVLNADYNKQNADTAGIPEYYKSFAANCGFRFVLAGMDAGGSISTGIVRKHSNVTSFTVNDDMKFSTKGGDDAWDRDRYLNIWVCNLSPGDLGYSSVIGGPKETDGVVVTYTAFGTKGTAQAPFNRGRTGTHEIGHWLNLIHVWGDADCGDDEVSDTPPQSAATRGDPSGIILSCGNTPYGNMYMDYMDFTDDIGMHMFTYGQRARMLTLFAPGGFRYPLLSSTVPAAAGTSSTTGNQDPVTSGNSDLRVYPNPARGTVQVKLEDPACIGLLLEIYDQMGQKILDSRITNLSLQLNVTSLSSGVYFLRVKGSYTIITTRLVKL